MHILTTFFQKDLTTGKKNHTQIKATEFGLLSTANNSTPSITFLLKLRFHFSKKFSKPRALKSMALIDRSKIPQSEVIQK